MQRSSYRDVQASPLFHDIQIATADGDKGIYTEFYMKQVHQTKASEDEGRPIFKEVPYIRLTFPGDKNKIVDRPVDMVGYGERPSDVVRFARQWHAFQAQTEQTVDGWAIEEWPRITRSQALEFRGVNIHSVEALATVPDGLLDRIGIGAYKLREFARADLAQANDGKEITRLVSENESLKNDIQQLKTQFAELAAERKSHKNKGE